MARKTLPPRKHPLEDPLWFPKYKKKEPPKKKKGAPNRDGKLAGGGG